MKRKIVWTISENEKILEAVGIGWIKLRLQIFLGSKYFINQNAEMTSLKLQKNLSTQLTFFTNTFPYTMTIIRTGGKNQPPVR